ncbi:MAG: mechanosensitive ion channel domain-containing protein, partial [Acidimicrobiales bacterium]
MTFLLEARTLLSILVILAVPAAVVAAGELDERLRQRESPYRRPIPILRNWVLPSLAAWAVLSIVVDLEPDHLAVLLASTALVVSLSALALSVIRVAIEVLRRRRQDTEQAAPAQLLLALPRFVTMLVATWLLVGVVWGVDLSGLLTALGVTSLVVSFALQDTLSGLASGLLLLGDQPFRPGDWIRSGDIEGVVVDVNWRTTHIRTRGGDMIIVPNSQLAAASITNYTSPEPLHRVVVPVQVAYVNPPTLAKAMLLDAAAGTPGVLSDPAPLVRVTQIDDPLMGYEVHMWVDDYAIAPSVATEFGTLVWYQSHRHGVPLPSPAQDLYLYDGVAAGAAGEPTTSDIRRSLQRAPLLASLPDDQLDRLANDAKANRFSVGEVLVDSQSPSQDLMVIVAGRAEVRLTGADDSTAVISEVTAPQVVGAVEAPGGDGTLAVQAVTDCEVIELEASVAAEIGSRNAEMAAALNRIAEVRRRRVERT